MVFAVLTISPLALSLTACAQTITLPSLLAEMPDPEATLIRLRVLSQDRKWRELIERFEREDFAAWPREAASQASEAAYLRGQAHLFLKNGQQAEADLKAAVTLNPRNALAWLSRGDNCSSNLHDDQQALAAYRQVLTLTGRSNGWLPISATLAIARILTDQVKTDEALEVLQQYGDMEGMAPIWRIRMLRAYGHVHAAQGKEPESLAKFREALELETRQ
jgi:tetratricopeptide (TPR) repeat protein